MYKHYRHKLNMMYPGSLMLKLIAGLLILAGVLYLFGCKEAATISAAAAGVVILVMILLVMVELHEDCVLNEQAIRLDQKLEAAVHKKSFAMDYHGGKIWIEHLDSLGDHKEIVKGKFQDDTKRLQADFMTSYVAVNLDETFVDEQMLTDIIDTYVSADRPIRKLVFVGLSSTNQRIVWRLTSRLHPEFLIGLENDFEKAKEWLMK